MTLAYASCIIAGGQATKKVFSFLFQFINFLPYISFFDYFREVTILLHKKKS